MVETGAKSASEYTRWAPRERRDIERGLRPICGLTRTSSYIRPSLDVDPLRLLDVMDQSALL
jgi:hypothetical protein